MPPVLPSSTNREFPLNSMAPKEKLWPSWTKLPGVSVPCP